MTEQRLDRIERMLDTMATNLINERDARVAMREDNDEFYHTVQRWSEEISSSVNQLVEHARRTDDAINRLTESARETNDVIRRLTENAEADRAAIREIQTQVQGIQTENRRILDYLFGQRQNGNGEGQ